MKRRSFLAASGTALGALSAGCSEIAIGDERRDYAFGVYNGSRDSHSFRIRIGNTVDGGYFHQESLEMDGGTANENIPIEDVPSHAFIKIDSADELEVPWPASHSELGKIASRAEIYYEPTMHQELFVLSG